MQKIKSRIFKTQPVKWKELTFLQPENFKELTAEAYGKLRASIIANQFVETFIVWESKQTLYCLDGYHRIKILKILELEGYEIPQELPANFIACKDRKEASKLVLVYSSVYANTTVEGLQTFAAQEGLDLSSLVSQIDLPNFQPSDYSPQSAPNTDKLITESIRPYKRTHILISFAPERLLEIQGLIKQLSQIEGIEIEQASN